MSSSSESPVLMWMSKRNQKFVKANSGIYVPADPKKPWTYYASRDGRVIYQGEVPYGTYSTSTKDNESIVVLKRNKKTSEESEKNSSTKYVPFVPTENTRDTHLVVTSGDDGFSFERDSYYAQDGEAYDEDDFDDDLVEINNGAEQTSTRWADYE